LKPSIQKGRGIPAGQFPANRIPAAHHFLKAIGRTGDLAHEEAQGVVQRHFNLWKMKVFQTTDFLG
jgi:hypothetical protein